MFCARIEFRGIGTMSEKNRTYLVIDLKSFYASVECVERGLDPMTTNLVVADPSRTDKTICLAVSPSMKALGVRNRCRVFEIPKNIDYIMAPPRLQKYIDYSAEIYGIYLKYISKDDIYVYSIDECFLDVTDYLKLYNKTPREMGKFLMDEIQRAVGVRATCGIGPNMYLAKVALDITAKHADDFIGELDEMSYRTRLWDHKPLTDFWRVGPGTARRLARYGIYTMREIAEADEDLMFRVFGIDAELLIDHAWGEEPTTIADIKAYRPKSSSLSRGQVLMRDYKYDEGLLIAKEMMEGLSLDLVAKGLMAESVTMTAIYSHREEAEPARGTWAFDHPVNTEGVMVRSITQLYERIVDPDIPLRGIMLSCNNVKEPPEERQMSLFDMGSGGIGSGCGPAGPDKTPSYAAAGKPVSSFAAKHPAAPGALSYEESESRDRSMQTAINDIKKRFGKNAMFKAMDLEEAATTLERNLQIGGHKSGTDDPNAPVKPKRDK